MSIIDEFIIQDFEEYSFWIKASLRDYEYNEDLVENIGKLKRILQIMCEKYAGHKVIDKYIVSEIVFFPRAIIGCRYNIKLQFTGTPGLHSVTLEDENIIIDLLCNVTMMHGIAYARQFNSLDIWAVIFI